VHKQLALQMSYQFGDYAVGHLFSNELQLFNTLEKMPVVIVSHPQRPVHHEQGLELVPS